MTPRARKENLRIRSVGEQIVIYDQRRVRITVLNRTAALVWRHCDGKHTTAQLAQMLHREIGGAADEGLVELTLVRLRRARLLEAEAPRPADLPRRELLRRAAQLVAVRALLPSVLSLAALAPLVETAGAVPTTTENPEETTTPLPEETTTPLPEETTTPLPEETTTPAPEPIATTIEVFGTATYGGGLVTLTAIVRDANNQPVPQGGKVVFTFNGQTYKANTNAQGVATTTAPLPPGQQAGSFAKAVRAEYKGDGLYLPSTGSGPLRVARAILWLKPVDQSVKLNGSNPSSSTLQLANGSTFVNGDSWSALNLTNLRYQYGRNPPHSNSAEYVGRTYRMTAFGVTSKNYEIRYLPGTLTVTA